MIDPGELRHRITLQVKSKTRDAHGGESITWTDVATVWAKVKRLRGREYYAANKEEHRISAEITTRNVYRVTPDWRVFHDGINYNIVSAAPDMKGGYITMMCESDV